MSAVGKAQKTSTATSDTPPEVSSRTLMPRSQNEAGLGDNMSYAGLPALSFS